MKRIYLACGAGLATSEVIAQRVRSFLEEHGLASSVELITCSIADANKCAQEQDLVISTNPHAMTVACPVLNGMPFLTSAGKAKVQNDILKHIK